MVIPTHTTLINKTIVYSDTVLPLKESGKKLKICSISNISESSLEDCLKKIFESNPDVVFNTVQYSKKDKKVYFYTDQIISTKAWEESKTKKYKHINSNNVLEEISELLIEEKTKDPNCISLYDIANLIKKYKKKYDEIESKYEYYFEDIINTEFYDSYVIINEFDYNNKQLSIKFKYLRDYEKIVFSKENGDLYITKSDSLYAQKILTLIGEELSKLYDKLIEFSDFKNQYAYHKKTFNSNFYVDISNYGVKIFIGSPQNRFSKDFELSAYSYKDNYDYDCNSTSILTALKGKEDEIFKRIFVKIEDCPEWSKQELYQIRQEQLEEEKRIEEQQQNKERKKQKILELKRKILPWTK